MPTADGPGGSDAATPGIAEQFNARDTAGRVVVIEKLVSGAMENDIGGLEWSTNGPVYRLKNGGGVDRIDESSFRIADTGEVVRREEGDHGITDHTEHQTPARP